ncbi:uncharacterized protein LOC111675378 [Lucilia cuprina]|uniref:uncharacterized protein LOC111675378 n=1 Tax=Lucilia cuprina TaxID=7375 RepID=UPI001F051992|nr:uncharacterized protein LOC111675378 [Lucilia cuprina]XP_023291901.2 uncharacterized protein LOC111675378 [Lucilia cuprina]XP_046809782.1 uncharacterized protein LOC111675378 [Lucilia cuprina]
MEATKSLIAEKYQKLCNIMERETLGTEVLIYGTSGLMLLLAYAKRKPAYLVRPFKKPSHIPDRLINERVMHTGLIKDVQQKGQDTLLLISHRPLIPLFMSNKRLLPIKLPGVKVNGNGISWLQNCLVGREATFIPLNNRASDQYVVSQLCLVHPPKGNRLLDISETLLKLRFARFAEDANGSVKRNAKYYKHLANVEASTQSRESMLAKVSHFPWIWKAFYDFKASILPKEKLLPELVR